MEQIPHKCPVCDGEGQKIKPQRITSAGPQYENCRACTGTGVVWGWKTSEPQYPPVSVPYVQDWETISGGTITYDSGDEQYVPSDSTAIDHLPDEQWSYTVERGTA